MGHVVDPKDPLRHQHAALRAERDRLQAVLRECAGPAEREDLERALRENRAGRRRLRWKLLVPGSLGKAH